MADYTSGLQVIDISDPTNPTLAGTCDTPGEAWDVTVSGDHVFVADRSSGLQVIDISDPTNPTLAGTCDTPGTAFGVTVSGDHAFVADGYSGLQVIDISDPTNPTLAGTCDTPGLARGVTVSGDHAFVADQLSGLQVIDISDPTNPTLAGTYNTPGGAYDVTVSGDHAFVADYTSGLQVIDISDPTNPTLAGTCDTPGEAWDVTVSGDHVFVADRSSGLQVIDISDPTNPTLAGTCDTPGTAFGVTVSGDHAFVADHSSGLQVFQVFQSKVNLDDNAGRSLFVDASNDTIFRARLTTTQTNSVIWELSPDAGVSWQEIAPDGSWNQITVPGTDLLWRSTHAFTVPGVNPGVIQLEINWLYEAALIDSIVDVPDDQGGWVQAHFTRSGRDFLDEATLPISNYGIWRREDNTALIAALNSAASFPTEESATGDTPDLSGMPVITYQGRTYVQSRPGLAAPSFPPGTWELMVTEPAVQQDTYMAAVPTVGDSSGAGTNHTVFVMTAHTTTPSIWYVSEPDSGYSVDNLSPALPMAFGGIQSLAPPGLHLYWKFGTETDLSHYDIYKGPTEDFVPGGSNLVGSAADTMLLDTGWSPDDEDFFKLAAVDVHGNESPHALLRPENIYVGTLLQSFQASAGELSIRLSWTLSEAGEGMEFIVSRAEEPAGIFIELRDYTIDRDGLSFVLDDRSCEPGATYRYRIEVDDGDGRRILLETEGIKVPDLTLTLFQNVPNPFNPSTSIAFLLPGRSHVRIDVYDVAGRLVTTLLDEKRPAGRHTLEWDGREDSGGIAASGVYFYRLRAGKFEQTRKMILLR